MNFIASLLEPDPTLRLSLSDARLHPWLRDEHKRRSQEQGAAPVRAAAPVAFADASTSTRGELADASMASVAASDAMALDEPDEPASSGRMTPRAASVFDDSSEDEDEDNGLYGEVDVVRRERPHDCTHGRSVERHGAVARGLLKVNSRDEILRRWR